MRVEVGPVVLEDVFELEIPVTRELSAYVLYYRSQIYNFIQGQVHSHNAGSEGGLPKELIRIEKEEYVSEYLKLGDEEYFVEYSPEEIEIYEFEIEKNKVKNKNEV